MGANDFSVKAEGATAKEAFKAARNQALYDYGHRGYTGTIAEKTGYVMIQVPQGKDPYEYADELVEKGDPRVDDKWGPAGCIKLEEGVYLFFGWASS